MTRRNGYLRAVSYTALLELRALLAAYRLRRCTHYGRLARMVDGPFCGSCGRFLGPWFEPGMSRLET